jgi:hypothetical protein
MDHELERFCIICQRLTWHLNGRCENYRSFHCSPTKYILHGPDGARIMDCGPVKPTREDSGARVERPGAATVIERAPVSEQNAVQAERPGATPDIAVSAIKSAAKPDHKRKATRRPQLAEQRDRGRKRKGIRGRMRTWLRSSGNLDEKLNELYNLKVTDLPDLFGGKVGDSHGIYCRARNEIFVEFNFVS